MRELSPMRAAPTEGAVPLERCAASRELRRLKMGLRHSRASPLESVAPKSLLHTEGHAGHAGILPCEAPPKMGRLVISQSVFLRVSVFSQSVFLRVSLSSWAPSHFEPVGNLSNGFKVTLRDCGLWSSLPSTDCPPPFRPRAYSSPGEKANRATQRSNLHAVGLSLAGRY